MIGGGEGVILKHSKDSSFMIEQLTTDQFKSRGCLAVWHQDNISDNFIVCATVVKHSSTDPVIGGSNPATAQHNEEVGDNYL